MTRKDYELLAKALADTRPGHVSDECIEQWLQDRDAIAKALATDNPRFDMDRFIKATEV